MSIIRIHFLTFVILLAAFCLRADPPPYMIGWPLGKIDSLSTIHVGYGDYTGGNSRDNTEGFHPGIDFGIPEGRESVSVINPSFSQSEPTGYFDGDSLGYAVFLSYEEDNTFGWAIMHVDPPNGGYVLWDPDQPPNDDYETGEHITTPYSHITALYPWRHIHLCYFKDMEWEGGQFNRNYVAGFNDPVDYLHPISNYYDMPALKPALDILSPPYSERLVWFLAQGYDNPYAGNYLARQEAVWGNVDVMVNGASFDTTYACRNSASNVSTRADTVIAESDWPGLGSLRYRLRACDPYASPPYSEDAVDFYFTISNYLSPGRWRFLFSSADDSIPHDRNNPWRYKSLFCSLAGIVPDPWDEIGNNRYVITNCKDSVITEVIDPAAGWNTIVSEDDCYHDPPVHLSNGAWMTRSFDAWGLNENPEATAEVNKYSLFPDGAYRWEIKASSHIYQYGEMQFTLPQISLADTSEEEEEVFIAVDNYIPHIERVVLYKRPPSLHHMYAVSIEHRDVLFMYDSYWATDSSITVPGGTSILDIPREKIVESEYLLYPPLEDETVWGIAIQYSEPPNASTIDSYDIMLIGRIGNDTTYCNFRHDIYFEPITPSQWPDYYAFVQEESPPRSFWQLYEYEGLLFPEGNYVGELCASIPVGEVTDLGGNILDADPETIAHPRSMCINGDWPETGRDSADATVHNWGVPDYEVNGNVLEGSVHGQVLVEIEDFGQNYPGGFLGNADYWCGFWSKEFPYPAVVKLNRYKPDGSIGSWSMLTAEYPFALTLSDVHLGEPYTDLGTYSTPDGGLWVILQSHTNNPYPEWNELAEFAYYLFPEMDSFGPVIKYWSIWGPEQPSSERSPLNRNSLLVFYDRSPKWPGELKRGSYISAFLEITDTGDLVLEVTDEIGVDTICIPTPDPPPANGILDLSTGRDHTSIMNRGAEAVVPSSPQDLEVEGVVRDGSLTVWMPYAYLGHRVSIRIYDMAGRVVHDEYFDDCVCGEVSIDLIQEPPQGAYILLVNDETTNSIQSRKFLVF